MTAERKANIADLQLVVAGKDITADARPRLVSLQLAEKRGGEADQLDLVLDDGDGKLDLPKKGAIITLKLGWKQGADVKPGLVDKGTFKVDEVSWTGEPDQISITARAADLTSGFRARKEKSWVGKTLGDVAKEVAANNGLEARVAPELASIAVPAVVQHQQSDMALLRRLGRENDAVATVKQGKLILSPIGKGQTSTGKALPSVTIDRGAGSRPNYREVDRSAEAGVEARYHDQDSGKRHTVTSGGGGSGKRRRLRKVYPTEAEAKRAAAAEAKRAKRGEAEFTMTIALGRPDIAPECRVTLTGFKDQVNARKWVVAELTHSLDGQAGFTTNVKLETAG